MAPLVYFICLLKQFTMIASYMRSLVTVGIDCYRTEVFVRASPRNTLNNRADNESDNDSSLNCSRQLLDSLAWLTPFTPVGFVACLLA